MKNIQIREEILRYLGYRGQTIDSITEGLIQDTMEEIKSLINPRFIYKQFNICKEDDKIYLKETGLHLSGIDVRRFLENSETCILMAATLGHVIDTKIRYYQRIDMTKALILDAVATTYIEQFCDKLCEEIESNLPQKDKILTNRYSPGYGDLPIDIQNDFLKTLDTQRAIGLTVSSSNILIPRKSVTAIMGIIGREEKKEPKNCTSCSKYGTCAFNKV